MAYLLLERISRIFISCKLNPFHPNMRRLLVTFTFVIAMAYLASAQVQIDQRLEMIGVNDADRRITNVGNPAAVFDAVNTSSLQKGSLTYAPATGTIGNYVVTLSPAPTAYTIGMM